MTSAAAARTTYQRAAAGYDTEFEAWLVAAITTAIADVSRVSDANVICTRTAETASALVRVLAGMLAMSPAAARSPTAIRKTVDELGKRLRARVAHATADPELQESAPRLSRHGCWRPRMTGKLSIHVEGFKPHRSNTLVGFCVVTIPELRLRIHDLTVHEKNESRWVGMPGKAQITRDGTARKDDRGKVLYTPTIEFTDKATRDAFSRRVIAALLEFAPAAFEEEEVA